MPWYAPWSDLLKKKVCRYLLQRYLGQFLKEKLTLEQLNVDLYNGRGTVYNVALYSEALNELCESQGWGIEVTGGSIGSVTVTIPWNALMTDDSYIEVTDLYMTIRPRARQTDGTSMLESMWSSVSSSIQLAQECLEKEGPAADINYTNAQNATIEGLEKFAQTIDSVLNRIKAKFANTTIRLEYLPPKSDRGIALVIKIKHLEYKNEAGSDPPDAAEVSFSNEDSEDPEGHKTHLISSYATHHIKMEGITFYTEEFRIMKANQPSKQVDFTASSQFYSTTTISQLPETEQFLTSETSRCTESDSDDTDSETESSVQPDNTTPNSNSRVIQFCSWDGTQEIRLRMKQSENILGPKASLELSFGAINLFLTPRQIHLIVAFCDAFTADSQRKETKFDKTIRSSKRLREIKRSNSQGHFSSMSGAVMNDGGWSYPEDDARHHQQKEQQSSGYRESTKSFEIPESLGSSMTSSSSTTNSSKIRKRGTNVTINGDISRYSMRMTSFTIFLLHEDVLVECCTADSDSPLSEESVSHLLSLSSNFFANDGETKNSLHGICNKNHIKINLCPIILEGEEHRNNSMKLLKFSITVARADLIEVLDNIQTPILKFTRPEFLNPGHSRRPEVALQINYITPTIQRTGSKRRTLTKTDLVLSLESGVAEFDISLYDRLSSLFSTSPFSNSSTKTTKSDGNNSSSTTANKSNDSSSSTELNIESPVLDIRLRFPINDSRPLHDENRVPWWKKNIRDDFLLFTLQRFRLKYLLSSTIEITANEIDIFYCENCNAPKIHIGKTSLIENKMTRATDSCVDFPRLKIEFPSEKALRSVAKHINEDSSDSGDTSCDSYGGTIYARNAHERSPFSSKRVCRESDTPHSKESSDDPETLLLPGDSEEMRRFRETSMQTSRTQIQLHFPVASIQVNSKHLYEILYNRLNTDLLMWQSVAPKYSPEQPQHISNSMHSFMNAGMMDSIYIPSTTQNDSAAESESNSSGGEGPETDGDSDTMYYSTYDRKRTSKRSLLSTPAATNSCSFQLSVGQGVLTLFAPVRGSDNNVIPGQLGEFVISLKAMTLFSVSGYQENRNLAYVCLHAQEAELRHCGLIPGPEYDPPLRIFNQPLPDYLQATLYPAPHDLTLRKGRGSIDREMLSLAIQIKAVPEQRIKRLRVTVGLQTTTLRHCPTLSQHTWLNQIIDMFDILDYPIEGYIPFGVVTEMQLHLWDCSIDYRPLYFPHRAVLDLGSFMISSNLTTAVSGCTLRFVAEECTLCLAPYDTEQNNSDITSEFLVSVVDAGLVEISLRLNEKATQSYPKLDLRASIQDVHIRTCSDSGQALAQLIGYFAGDCDLKSTVSEVDESEHLPDRFDEAELLPMRKSSNTVPEVSPKQQERVNSLMADAMQESIRIVSDSDDDELRFDTGVEVFFFPDETHQLKKVKEEKDAMLQSVRLPPRPKRMLPSRSALSKSMHEPFRRDSRRESQSSDEMRDILNFESSIMATSYMLEDEAVEAVPQVSKELGEVQLPIPSSNPLRYTKKMSSDTDEDYCIIAEEEKAYMANCGVRNLDLTEDPIRIVDNHFSVPVGKPDLLRAPPDFPMAVVRYTLCEMTLTWHLHGGHDFPKKSDDSQADKDKSSEQQRTTEMSNAYKMGVSYAKGQPGIHFGPKPLSKLSLKTCGGQWRKHDVLLEIQINKVRLSHEIYPAHTIQASRQVLLITELEIRDKLQTSEINKFLYHPSTKSLPKKSSQHMVVMKALHVRPNPVLPAQECCLRISLLPLRLNIDQDTLLFLVEYFTELGASGDGESTTRSQAVTPHQPPVMTVDEVPEAVQDLQARKMVSENLMLLMEEEEKKKEPPEVVTEVNNDAPIYFREIIFSPEVVICLDYHGRRVELSRGPIAGLLMGLGQLQCSQIRLKKICYRKGVLGFDRLLSFLFKEWLQDIKKNQLPTILSGVGPMYTFIQLFQGIRDLFWLPIEQYQKDGRIVRGLQLGAQSFTARTALAALEITARLIQLLQLTAETAYDMVSPGPSVKRTRHNRKGKRKRMHRPQDIREGVANAYQIVKEGIGETAQNLVDVTCAEHDQKGYTGAVGAVVRQIPPIVVRPVVLVTQATSNVLGGVRNQFVPDARIEAREKWKEDDQ